MMKQQILPQMKMQKFEADISAFREELIIKKTNFTGIPKLNLKEEKSEVIQRELTRNTSATERGVLAPP